MSKVIEVAQHQWQKRPLLVLFLVILLLNLPVLLGWHPLKWDAIDISYPQRSFVSTCLRNGIMPFWNPFQFMGFSVGHLPETWYPISLLIGITIPYPIWALNVEYLFHLCIAAWGMYKICLSLRISKNASLWTALSFACCGFFTSHAQHLGWIIAGAWIPHVWFHYKSFLGNTNERGKHALLTIWFSFMLLSGGYTAYAIIMLYILFAYTLIFIIRQQTFNKSTVFALLSLGLGLLSAAAIVWKGNLYLFEHLERAQEQLDTLEGSWRWWHALTFIAPSSLKANSDFWQADVSLINVYAGIPFLLLLIHHSAFRNRIFRNLLVLGSICFLVALGKDLPLRTWFNILPGFSLFRFPSLFRYFGILCWILASGISFDLLMKSNKTVSRMLVSGLGIILLGILISTLVSDKVITETLMAEMSLIGLVIGTWLLIQKRIQPSLFIICWSIFNFAYHQYSVGDITIYDKSVKLRELNRCLQITPKSFKSPLIRPLASMPDKNWQIQSVYRNTNSLFHSVGIDGYTPYLYESYQKLEQSEVYPLLIAQPMFFFASKTGKVNDVTNAEIHWSHENKIEWQNFSPNNYRIKVALEGKSLLLLNQNYDADWHVFVDGNERTLQRAFENIMAVDVPVGTHEIEWIYDPSGLKIGLLITVCSLGIGVLVYLGLYASRIEIMSFVGISLVVLIGYFIKADHTSGILLDQYSKALFKAEGKKQDCFFRNVISLDSLPSTINRTENTFFGFEQSKKHWTNNTDIYWSPEWNHQRVQRISESNPYGGTFEKKYVAGSGDYATLQLDVKSISSTVYLSLQLEQQQEKLEYYIKRNINGDEWQTIKTKFDLTNALSGNLKIYCSHGAGTETFIDNVEIHFSTVQQQ